MSSINTAVCWSCAAPVEIYFKRGAALTEIPALPGVRWRDNVLVVTAGEVKKPFRSQEIVLLIPAGEKEFRFTIPESRFEKITDRTGQALYE